MSLTSAMYTGVSGLLSNSEAMNVIGNNIANVNTTGFKSGRTVFSDMLSDQMGNSQVGTGTTIQDASDLFTQGSVQKTGNVTDLCISGNSFFALKAPGGAAPVATQDAAFLSRAGSFHVDDTHTLVNPDGYQVLDTQGNPIRFVDTFSTTMDGFKTAYGTGTVPAQIATDFGAVNGAAGVDANLLATAKTAADAVSSAATAYAAAPTASTVSTLAGAISAAYDAIVKANQSAPAASQAVLTVSAAAIAPLTTAADAVAASWKTSFGGISRIGEDGLISYLGRDGVTQNYYKASGVSGVAADSANTATVQRLALVSALDPSALQKVGGSLYKAVTQAGVSSGNFSLASNAPNGSSNKIISNSLEASTADMAKEFVSMITTQRAYSANSRTITTTDQMTQEVLGLIR